MATLCRRIRSWCRRNSRAGALVNYRHIFHAGNICDVVKHAVLTAIVDYLKTKPAPFCVIDTHAGVGLYDLQDERARKTDEAQSGVMRFLQAPRLPELAGYYDVLKKLNPGWQTEKPENFRFYPGSPLLAAHLVRPQDRVIACELHPEDVEVLKRNARPFSNLHIHHRDGYEGLGAFVPPAEKRGIVMIDPPYESGDEFSRLSQEVIAAHKSWPQGMFMVWYPVKDRAAIWRFHEAMMASGIPRQFCAEFIYEEETRHDRLNGCGILLINPPWQFDDKLRQLLPQLHTALQTTVQVVKADWLVGEKA